MTKLPKVYIELGQDNETPILTVDISQGVSIDVVLDQKDVDYLKKLIAIIEKLRKEKKRK